MAYSSQSFTSDGSVSYVDVVIDYASRDDIRLYYDDVRILPSSGKWSWVGTTDKLIHFTPSPAAGVLVKIARVTDMSAMTNDFSDNAMFNSENMDENFDQLLHLVQEVSENGTSGGGTPGDVIAANVAFESSTAVPASNVQSAVEYVRGIVPQPAANVPSANGIGFIGNSTRYALEDHTHPGGGGGGGGTDGTSTGLVYAYKRALTQPTDNPGDVTFNFTVPGIVIPAGDALANGWTKTIPSGTNPLWAAIASASSTTTTDNIAANEWATPVKLVENGANGNNGVNTATVFLYQRKTTNVAPSLPSADITYAFSPPTVTGITNGWATTIPAASAGEYLFVTSATAASTTSTDIIGPTEWAAVSLMARNGVAGATGSNGVDGQRGTIQTVASGSAWSDSVANAAITSIGLGGPYNRDIVTITNSSSFTQTRFYNGGSWVVLTAYIDGNLLVTGTLSAAKITSGTLDSVAIRAGTGHGPNSRAFEVSTTGATWIEFVSAGAINGSNAYLTTGPAITGITGTSGNAIGHPGVLGQVFSTNSNVNALAMRGLNSYSGTDGRIGTPGHAFYAQSGLYGPFTGSHDVLLDLDQEITAGDIAVDRVCISRTDMTNTIFLVDVSSEANQRGAIGVFAYGRVSQLEPSAPPAAFEGDEEYAEICHLYNLALINAVGEGQVNVVGEGGDIAKGDLIVTSSTPGKGMRQADDIVRSYTVARAREAVRFTGNEVRQVACVYLCG